MGRRRSVTKALLKREVFPGTIWEPAAGRGHIVRVLLDCGYPDVLASDKVDWGFKPCRIEDFLAATANEVGSVITNPPFDLKAKFLSQAKLLARHKIAMLLPVEFEHTMEFVGRHATDPEYPWKALYSFPQGIPWANVRQRWGKVKHGWFVFERAYRGQVVREAIVFRRNASWSVALKCDPGHDGNGLAHRQSSGRSQKEDTES